MQQANLVFSSLMMLILISACGPVTGYKAKENSANPPNEKPGSTGSLSYKFEDFDQTGAVCTTGNQRFQNLKSFCLNIQNNELNGHCAKAARAKRFIEVCESAGFSQLESLSCDFTLLNKNSIIGSDGTHSITETVATAHYCVGYQKDESPDKYSLQDERVLMTQRGKDLVLKIQMNFAPEQDKSQPATNALIEYYSVDSEMKTKVLIDPYSFKNDGEFKTKPTNDFRYRYLIKCVKSWAC